MYGIKNVIIIIITLTSYFTFIIEDILNIIFTLSVLIMVINIESDMIQLLMSISIKIDVKSIIF